MLKEVFVYFLKMGILGFGGPLALIASFQKDLIEKRKWCSHTRFTQNLSLIKAMPGPVATQMAIHLGSIRAGAWGGIVAGLGLIFPSFVMMLAFGYYYSSITHFRFAENFLSGTHFAALALILDSVFRLSKPYFNDQSKRILFLALFALASGFVFYSPSKEPVVILGFGLVGAFHNDLIKLHKKLFSINFALLAAIGWVCFKAGAFVFGTGLAIVPLLAHEVVEKHHWLTHGEFLNALALGQITPGPVTISATFIGFKSAGITGAIVATAGIFFMSFFNMLTWFGFAEKKLANSSRMPGFVLFAISAVVGSIFVAFLKLFYSTSAPLGHGALSLRLSIFIVAFTLSAKNKLPAWALILCAGFIGAVLF